MRVVKAVPRELYRWVPVLLPFVVVAVFVVRGAATPDFPHLTAPAGVTLPVTVSTSPPSDLTGVRLSPVDGTTTTLPLRTTGSARLGGTVRGPDGPVGGAIVRIERIGIDWSTDAVAGSDGRWGRSGISGGRYRARAFLPPDLTQTEPEVFYLAENEEKVLTLAVDRFAGLTISSNNAPDPPVVGQLANVAILVVTRVVDGDGFVRSDGVAGATVTVSSAAGFILRGPAVMTTSPSGFVQFTVQCSSDGANQLVIAVQVDPLGPSQGFAVTTSPCVNPPPLTAPPPTFPPATSSSSTSSSAPAN